MFRMRLVTLAILAAVVAQAVVPASAFAHERRTVGKYTFVVGFLTEPAFEGEPNAASVSITDVTANQPVTGAEQTLKVAIAFGGGQPKELPLQTQFGQPGSYVARLIPTRSGAYIFTFTGTIQGQTINERFESGPGRFNDVQSPQTLQFPESVLATSEIQTKVTGLERRMLEAEDQAAVAEGLANSVRRWAVAGLAAGTLGLLAGVYGVLGRRRGDA